MRPSSPKRCVRFGSLKKENGKHPRKRWVSGQEISFRFFFNAEGKTWYLYKNHHQSGWVFLSRLWVPCSGLDAGFSNQKKEAILHFSNFTHLRTLTGDLYISHLWFTICVKMTWRWKSCYHIIHNVSMRPRLLLLHRWSLHRMKRRSVEGQLWRLLQQVVGPRVRREELNIWPSWPQKTCLAELNIANWYFFPVNLQNFDA